MNSIQKLKKSLDCKSNLSSRNDVWFLDIVHGTKYITVCWRSRKGFLLSDDIGAVYEKDCKEKYPNIKSVKARIDEIISSI